MKKKAEMQMLFRLARQERGVALVEFAMTLWVLMLLVGGVIQCGLALYAYHFMTYAAEQGARYAEVRGSTWSENTPTYCGTSAPPSFTMMYSCTAAPGDIQNFVQSLAAGGIFGANGSAVTVDESGAHLWPGTTPCSLSSGCPACTSGSATPGCIVKVKVMYTFHLIPFLPVSGLTMSGTSQQVILQ